MTLAVCSRSGDIIEPLVQPQWFVDCTGPAKRACDAVRDGSLRIRPKMHERTWFKWFVAASLHRRVDAVSRRATQARGHKALVHLAPALVGPPDPRVVRVSQR